MQAHTAETKIDGRANDHMLTDVLRGYRFGVCETPWQAEEALEIRRRVYVEESGYEVSIPDDVDRRSWLLYATEESTGRMVGSMRVTPRFAGPLEAEEFCTLPSHLQTRKGAEISRFAILRGHRKGQTFIPAVSFGLFRAVFELLERIGAERMVICARPERVWTYEWLHFERTGVTASYGALGGAEHVLLYHDLDLRKMSDHPFLGLFAMSSFREVVLPRRIPLLGLAGETAARHAQRRLAVGACA